MTKRRRRKCLNCGRLFRPDPRNRRHQRYCSAPDCRKASKAVSQARWLSKRKRSVKGGSALIVPFRQAGIDDGHFWPIQ